MSEYTSNLQLFKYDTATDGKEVFSINASMNDNWDKIDAFAAGIKSLSNLDEQGEKRFTDINAELNKKLEAEVLLAENGYIKFNNNLIIQYSCVEVTTNGIMVGFPISFSNTLYTLVPCGHWVDQIYTQTCSKTVTGFTLASHAHNSTWYSGWIAMGY